MQNANSVRSRRRDYWSWIISQIINCSLKKENMKRCRNTGQERTRGSRVPEEVRKDCDLRGLTEGVASVSMKESPAFKGEGSASSAMSDKKKHQSTNRSGHLRHVKTRPS